MIKVSIKVHGKFCLLGQLTDGWERTSTQHETIFVEDIRYFYQTLNHSHKIPLEGLCPESHFFRYWKQHLVAKRCGGENLWLISHCQVLTFSPVFVPFSPVFFSPFS